MLRVSGRVSRAESSGFVGRAKHRYCFLPAFPAFHALALAISRFCSASSSSGDKPLSARLIFFFFGACAEHRG